MPNKNTTIVFTNELEFVGVFYSWNEAARELFDDESKSGMISRYAQGQNNDLQGYVALPFEGYLTAKRISDYKGLAKRRKLLSCVFKIDFELVSKLSDEDAQAIDDIIKKYI